jgi:transcriptional regulator GlxA family with amidase domain
VPIQRPSTVRHRTSLFEDATAIVEREFASELSLDDIARRVASSRRQLQRAYAEIGDTTFRDHLTRVRMYKAAEMLATRGLTVAKSPIASAIANPPSSPRPSAATRVSPRPHSAARRRSGSTARP